MNDRLTAEQLDELERLLTGFHPSSRVTTTVDGGCDSICLMSQYEDTEPTTLIEIPNDDEWRPDFAALLFGLWGFRAILIATARREARLRDLIAEADRHKGAGFDTLAAAAWEAIVKVALEAQ